MANVSSMTAQPQPHPFVFFGAEPSDWFDPEDHLFSYELCFAVAPDAAARLRIAEAWEQSVDDRAIPFVAPFLWADRWALVRVRPAGWNRTSIVGMARAAQQALARVHDAHPIDEAALAEALESDSPWDAWSLAERPAPRVGPRWPAALPTSGDGARFEAASAEDPEFERARVVAEAARREARAARAEATRAGAAEQPAGGDEDDGAARGGGDEEGGGEAAGEGGGEGPRVVEGDLRVERLRGREQPKAPEPSDADRKLFGARGAHVAVAPDGRVYGVAKPRRRPPAAAWLEDGALRIAEGDPLPSAYDAHLAARDDGGAALLALESESVWEIVFADGRARRLFQHEDSMSGVAYGLDDRVVLLAQSSADVYRREGDGAVLEQRWAIDGYSLRSIRGGRLLVVNTMEDGDDGITVYGFDGPTLRRMARVVMSVSEAFVVGDRVLVDGYGEDYVSAIYELSNWDALLDKLASVPAAFPEVAVYTEAASDDEESGDEEESDGDSDEDSDEEQGGSEDGDEESEESEDEESDGEDADEESESEEGDQEDDEGEDEEDEAPKARRRKKGPEDFVVEVAPGRVGLIHLGRKRPRPSGRPGSIPSEVRSAFGTVKNLEAGNEGNVFFGWKKEGKRALRFAVHYEGRVVDTSLTTASSPSDYARASWDGRRILVPTDDDAKLWCVDLPEGKVTLVHDFSEEEDENEVYTVLALAYDRILVGTLAETWIFSLATGAPALEARGKFDIRDIEAASDGRGLVVETSDGKPLRVWGVHEHGLCTLAEFDLEPSSFEVRDGRVLVDSSDGHGWFELTNLEDAWQAARYDTSGTQYPKLELKREERSKDDEDEDEDEDEDDEGDQEESEDEDEDEESEDEDEDE